jgi:acetoin utilization protein AcuB
MSRNLITLPPRASIAEAVKLFLEQRISCIPIVDQALKPVGILSWRDVLKTLLPAQNAGES